MNEQKLYAVNNDEGKWSDGGDYFGNYAWATPDKDECERDAKQKGGHVVTLIEEPEKVVITKEQAKIVDDAHDSKIPACHISNESDDEELLMNAYVNGYTVAKEKKYNVKVPLVQAQGGLWFYINSEDKLGATYLPKMAKKFTMEEIEENGLQDCEKREVKE